MNNLKAKIPLKNRNTYTEREKELLCALVEQYKDVIENKATDGVTVKKKDEAWFKICNIYNAYDYSQRTPTQLKKCWDNLVQRKRKYHTNQKAHRLITGGGPPLIDKKDKIMEKVESITAYNDIEIAHSMDSTAAYEKSHNIPSIEGQSGVYYIKDSDDEILTDNVKTYSSVPAYGMNYENQNDVEEDRSILTENSNRFANADVNKNLKITNLNNVSSNMIRLKEMLHCKNDITDKENNNCSNDVKELLNQYCPYIKDKKHKFLNPEQSLKAVKVAESIVQQRELHKINMEKAKCDLQLIIIKLLKEEEDLQNKYNEDNVS